MTRLRCLHAENRSELFAHCLFSQMDDEMDEIGDEMNDGDVSSKHQDILECFSIFFLPFPSFSSSLKPVRGVVRREKRPFLEAFSFQVSCEPSSAFLPACCRLLPFQSSAFHVFSSSTPVLSFQTR